MLRSKSPDSVSPHNDVSAYGVDCGEMMTMAGDLIAS